MKRRLEVLEDLDLLDKHCTREVPWSSSDWGHRVKIDTGSSVCLLEVSISPMCLTGRFTYVAQTFSEESYTGPHVRPRRPRGDVGDTRLGARRLTLFSEFLSAPPLDFEVPPCSEPRRERRGPQGTTGACLKRSTKSDHQTRREDLETRV